MQLVDEGVYDVKICGMVPSLAQALRVEEGRATCVEQCHQVVQGHVRAVCGDDSIRVAVLAGNAMRTFAVSGSASPGVEVAIYLMLDPLDIDSKWLTFLVQQDVVSGERCWDASRRRAVLAALYKFNPLATSDSAGAVQG